MHFVYKLCSLSTVGSDVTLPVPPFDAPSSAIAAYLGLLPVSYGVLSSGNFGGHGS